MRKYGRLQAFVALDLGNFGMETAELVYLPFQLGIVLIIDGVKHMRFVQILQGFAGRLRVFFEFPIQLAGKRLNVYLALSQGFKYVLQISQNSDPVVKLPVSS